MAQAVKMNNFFPPAGATALGAEFECFHPDPTFAAEQKIAMQDWQGGTLTAIKAEDSLAFVDLPKRLEHMIKHCWVKGSVTPGAQRGNVAIGGGRQTAFDKLTKSFNPADIFKAAKMKSIVHTPQVQAIASNQPYPHLQGIANDWKTMEQLQRINAYTFRGDTRAPQVIKDANGFSPPISRTDTYYVDKVVFPAFASYMNRRYGMDVTKAKFDEAYKGLPGGDDRKVLNNFFVWRSMVDDEAFHAGRMLASETLKGYISTSRAVPIARTFAKRDGWVYLTLVRGGFLIPDRGATTWTEIFGEQEVALPGPLPWAEIFGFRQVGEKTKLAGPVYFRKGFEGRNKTAFNEAFELLSGKRQT